MATSGSTDFTVSRDDIIQAALRKLGAIGQGETPATAAVTEAAQALNLLVKAMQNSGANLWTRSWIQQTLTASNVVSNGGSNYVCVKSHTSASATEPGTGANWTSVWELTTDTAGGAWADATSYNYIGDFSLASGHVGVVQAFIREANTTGSSITDYALTLSPFGSYLDISDKYTAGSIPTHIYFDEGLGTNTGYMYPTPQDTDMVLHMLATRTIEDFDASSDNPDYPVRWHETLVYGLAYRLGPEYGFFGQNLSQLNDMYRQALSEAKKEDKEIVLRFASPTYAV